MATNKDSKRKKLTKKSPLSVSKRSKPLVKSSVPKKIAKRKAKQVKKRMPSQYDVVRGIVADYCLRNYGRRCTRAESKAIYQSLKLRFLNKEIKTTTTLSDIKMDIDKVLANKNDIEPPESVTLPFPYYELLSRLYDFDGGYFNDDDTLIFDLTAIGEGKVKTPYAELPYAYKTEIYERYRNWSSDVNASGIEFSDKYVEFVYDADSSNVTKRIFIWKLSLDEIANKYQAQTSKEIKKGEEEKERNLEYNKEKIKEKIEDIKESIDESRDALAIEKEKTKQEQEKTKQKDIEKDIAKEKTKQDAMALLQAGKIDLETFLKIIG